MKQKCTKCGKTTKKVWTLPASERKAKVCRACWKEFTNRKQTRMGQR